MRTLALNNGLDYYLVCLLYRGKSCIKIGVNSHKTHPIALRIAKHTRLKLYGMHAEHNVLRFAKPGDKLVVVRYTKGGSMSMAFPCKWCLKTAFKAGISKISFTDRGGKLQRIRLTKLAYNKLLEDFEGLEHYPYHLFERSGLIGR